MVLEKKGRRQPRSVNNLLNICYMVMKRGPRSMNQPTWRSKHHYVSRRHRASREYEAMNCGAALMSNQGEVYRCGYHCFRFVQDARNACELGQDVIVKVVARNPIAYGHVILGGNINLGTGKPTDKYLAAVNVTRYIMIIKEVQ